MEEKIRSFCVLMRPHQYLKNVFLFLPLFFGGMITHADLLLRCMQAFLSFCLVASAVYVFNDYIDAGDDRQHPDKSNRPIAAGKVTGGEAFLLAGVCVLAGAGSAASLGRTSLLLIAVYLILNIAYTMKIKHIPLLDVFCIAAGFDLRLFVGSAATGITLSFWIIIMTFLLALFIAFAKRRDDLALYLKGSGMTRKSLDGYNMEVLNAGMIIMAAVVIVCYIMYTVSPEIIRRGRTEHVYITTAFVILGILRYLQITFAEEGAGTPTKVLLKDRFLQATVAGWLLACGLILYS